LDSTERVSPWRRLVGTATKIHANELTAALLSFLFVFLLMAAYFLLRPARDAMASDWSDAEVSWLWTLNFFISVGAVFLYGWAISNMPFRRIIPAVYAFFAASFFVFYIGTTVVDRPVLIDKSFYVWLSVFSLFHVSVFWSFMSDIYSKEQSTRLFGFIAVGSSVGAIVGPAIAAATADVIAPKQLMLLTAVLLLVPIPIIIALGRLKETALGNAGLHADPREQSLGRNPFSGFTLFLKSPFLLGIGAFILLYVAISSFIYFEQKNLLEPFERARRTEILALVTLTINTLAIVTAMFVTSRLATRLGLAVTLALVPALVVLGLLVLAFSPILAVVLGLQVARSAGNYAITRPGREMLFTLVGREARFKAKPVIDIVFYRGGDMVWAWAFTWLTTALGLGLGAVAAVGAGIAAIWACVGFFLGRSFDRLSDDEQADVAQQVAR